jgi:hypothetical protein
MVAASCHSGEAAPCLRQRIYLPRSPRSRAVHYAAQAKANIATFSESTAKQSLLSFADFVVEREK